MFPVLHRTATIILIGSVCAVAAGCGKTTPTAATATTATQAQATTVPLAAPGPTAGVTAAQLCTDWAAVRPAYLAAPPADANQIILGSKFHADLVAYGPSDALSAAGITLQTPASSATDRQQAADDMTQACSG